MGRILSDLSYNNKTLKPIGRPVDDLKALYKEKKDDYNYVIDSLNATETALNQVPSHDKDKGIVDVAKQKFTSTFNEFEDTGDFENRIVDTKRLANDLTNKYGLLDVQRVANEQAAYQGTLKKRLDDGEITRQQYQNAVVDSERKYKGLQKDETTGQYIGQYNGTQVQNFVNASEKVAEALKGFKAGTIFLTDRKGNQIVNDPSGSGYFITGTKESVSEAELIDAAKAHIASSPDIQSQFQEDTYFEMENLLNDENGNRRDVIANDIRSLITNSNSKAAMAQLGINSIDDINNLDEVLEGKDLEAVYKYIKNDQLVNDAMRLGVAKESYEKYEAKYLKNWMMEYRLDNQDAIIGSQYELLHTYDNAQNLTSDDIARTAETIEKGKENLNVLQTELSTLKGSADAQRKANLETDIARQKLVINDIEEQKANIFEAVDMSKVFDNYRSLDEAVGTTIVDIPEAELKNLIYAEINGTLTDEDLQNSIGDFQSFEQWQQDTEAERTSRQQTADDAYNAGAEDNTNFQTNLSSPEALQEGYEDYKTKKLRGARGRVRHASKYFQNKIDENDKDYVNQYNTLLFSKMSPTERRAHPLASNWDIVENLYETDPGFYRGMSSVNTNLSLKTQIEEEFGLGKNSEKDGSIKWDTATVLPTLSYRPDRKNGKYRPALTVQVKVVTSKKGADGKPVIQDANMPVFYDNENYEERFKENLTKYRSKLMQKASVQGLSPADNKLLDDVNLNLYNATPYSSDIDLLNLHSLPNGADSPVRVNPELNMNVRSYKNNSPSGQSFYVTEGTGENAQFLGFDNQGEPIRLTEAQMRQDETVKKINSGEYKMLGGNTVTALKTQFADMTFSQADAKRGQGNALITNTSVDLTDLRDIAKDPNIRLADNNFEQTYIHNDIYDDVVDLFKQYPSILATDISRNENTAVAGSAPNSAHKLNNGAKAIDIRANDDSEASKEALSIHALGEREKRKLGIERTIKHGDGSNLHVHIKFI